MPSKYREYLNDFEQWPFIYGYRFFLPAGSITPFALVPDNSAPTQGDADFIWRSWSIDMSETTGELVGLSPASSPEVIGVRFRMPAGGQAVELISAVNRAISAYPQVTTFFGTAQIL